MDALTARKTWRTLEPIHAAIYFVAEAGQEYAAIGLGGQAAYFASRAAPMGSVAAEVVTATFFNFDHDFVRRSMAGVWDSVTPSDVTAARLRAADQMMRRLVPEAVSSAEIVEAAELARRVALAASARPEGRPLFAGHASLPWPDEAHLVLWHAQSLLREYRGDGHIAALVAAGLDGCEALVTHAAAGDVPAQLLKSTRQRTDADWRAAVERLQARGWLDADGALTDYGRERRQWIEDTTDELTVNAYGVIGVDGCARVRELARPISRQLAAVFG